MKKPIKPSARQALAAAIRHRDDAQVELARLESTKQKAIGLRHALADELAQFDDLDSQISAAKANIVRRCLEHGEEPDFDAMPSGYASRLISRENIQTKLASVDETIAVLESELQSAKSAVKDADIQLQHSAADVLAEEAESIAQDFLGQLDELRATQYLLQVLSQRQIPRTEPLMPIVPGAVPTSLSFPMTRITMPPSVHEALTDSILGSYEYKHGTRLRDKMGVVAQRHWQELLKDADAHLNIESDTKPTSPQRKVTAPKLKAQLANRGIELTP